jgi:hypothetical protein
VTVSGVLPPPPPPPQAVSAASDIKEEAKTKANGVLMLNFWEMAYLSIVTNMSGVQCLLLPCPTFDTRPWRTLIAAFFQPPSVNTTGACGGPLRTTLACMTFDHFLENDRA